MGTVLLLGALVTGINAFLQYEQINTYHQERFQSQTQVAVEQAGDRIQNVIALLQGMVALFDSSQTVSRTAFHSYILAMDLEHNFTGVVAAGFLPHLRSQQLPGLAAQAAKEGLPGYEVRPWAVGESMADIHTPIWFLAPSAGSNAALLGKDPMSNPDLAQVLALARDSGQASMSGQVAQMNSPDESLISTVMLVFPVYQTEMPHFTTEQRRQTIRGYVFVAVHLAELLAGVGGELGVDLEVFDGPRVDTGKMLFDTDLHRLTDGGYRNRFAEKVETRVFAQRAWTWYEGSLPSFEAGIDYRLIYLIVVGGVLTTTLVVILIGYLGRLRMLADSRARDMTVRLRQHNTTLSNTINELEYQKMVLDSHAIVSITDYRGDITYVNDKFCDISGYRREELVGQNHRIVKSTRHPKAFYDLMWSTIVSGDIWQGELCNLTKDGREYWVKTTIVPFLDENGVPERYVSARTDITALKKTRDELQQHRDHLHELVQSRTQEAYKAKEEAEAASMAKSQFLANMSHELRTPIHAVLSYSELGEAKADREEFSGDKARNYFHRIHQSGQRLLGLINDLLDLSKMEAGHMHYEMRPASMHDVFNRVRGDLAGLLETKGLHLDLDGCQPEAKAVFDSVRIEQVVINLLSNAHRFSPQGGHIKVHCQTVDMPGRRSTDTVVAGLQVSISDQGPGIPPLELESIFEKFTQASHSKSGAGGTGLGLAICREILSAHRGRIWAENVAGSGARFVFEFPVDLPPSETA